MQSAQLAGLRSAQHLWQLSDGTPSLQVDSKGTMLNIYIDGDGNPQYVPVGNITDLRSVDVSSIGGVPIADLEKKVSIPNASLRLSW